MMKSRTVSVSIAASPKIVYEYAADPANLPQWAPGFVKSIANVDDEWVAQTTLGEVSFHFAPLNSFGVLDHGVTLPSGESFMNPMRVVSNGSASELLFTLFQQETATASEFEKDVQTVLGDLNKLKAVIEAGETEVAHISDVSE